MRNIIEVFENLSYGFFLVELCVLLSGEWAG